MAVKSYPPFGPQPEDFVFWFVVCFVAIVTPVSALVLWLMS